jgi:uncharacterized membrane protein YhaH (DUF805 family)
MINPVTPDPALEPDADMSQAAQAQVAKFPGFWSTISNLFSDGRFTTRASRGEFWTTLFFLSMVQAVLVLIPWSVHTEMTPAQVSLLSGPAVLWSIFTIVATLRVFWRRLQDLGRSGALALLIVAGLLNGLVAVPLAIVLGLVGGLSTLTGLDDPFIGHHNVSSTILVASLVLYLITGIALLALGCVPGRNRATRWDAPARATSCPS